MTSHSTTPRRFLLTSLYGNLLAVANKNSVEVSSNSRLSVSLYNVDDESTSNHNLQSTLSCKVQNHEGNVSISKLLLLSSTYCCALLSNNTLIVWNIARGVVVHTLNGNELKLNLLDIASVSKDSEDTLLYVLATSNNSKSKLYMYEYDVSTSVFKCLRKIKCGKMKEQSDGASCCLAIGGGGLLLIRTPSFLKVLSLHNGSKVGKKVKYSDSTQSSAALLLSTSCDNDESLVATTTSSGSVVVYRVDEEAGLEQIATIATTAAEEEASHLYVWQDNNSKNTTMVLVCAGIDSSTLYVVDKSNKIEVKTIRIQGDDQSEILSVLPSSNKLLTISRRTTNMSQQQQHELLFRSVSYRRQGESSNELVDKIVLKTAQDDKTEGETTMTSTATTNKRPITTTTTTLGPGQAGGEMLQVQDYQQGAAAKKRKVAVESTEQDEDYLSDQEMTIAERLAKLRQAMEEEDNEDDEDEEEPQPSTDFSPKTATTESLSHLLRQSLSSGDDSMLELALHVKDARVLQQSFQELEVVDMERLLSALTTRLACKPNRANELAIWIKLCLQSGKIHQPHQLRPLRNLLQERIESFPHLLRLEGRLSMLSG